MESSNLIPTPEEGPNRLHALPTGLVDNIIDFLIIEPDVTASDQTAQRRQNLSIFSLVCRRFDLIAKRDLYRIVRISTARGLRLFLRTVRSRPGTARLVEQLSLDLMLCGNIAAGPENHKLCLNMYWTLKCVTRLWVLSLRLMECNCCFRNSGLQDVAVNGANGKLQPVNRIFSSLWHLQGNQFRLQFKLSFPSYRSTLSLNVALASPETKNIILTNHSWIRQLLRENVGTHT